MRTGCQLGWILVSKIHQNLLLDGSWAVLWPSWAVLGRLGALLRHLEKTSKNHPQKNATKVGKKCVFRRLWPIWWGGIHARARAGRARVMPTGFGPEP